ncbi:DUF551 domain-containing protein [Escherichia coli]|nr:hypothetical protein G826_02611 [Escherichia coli HVH 171 (4-3191958)]MBS8596744.1 DUF551 domain-containing protein [Escherichia coli]HAH3602261.1 DUF551 domain-containing protein [Escherichia coli]HAX9625707.1 DUF551 domain-containing protein [Escherichia coli]HBN5807463.1 DUF551 domain-containing protein [Escherichia coli]
MTTITKERLLTIKQWRETYGPGSNVVLPAEEAEELARIALASLEAEPIAWECGENIILFNPDTVEAYAKRAEISPKPLYAAPPALVVPDKLPREYIRGWPLAYSDYAEGWNDCREAMLQSGSFRENKDSSTNNFRKISETSTNSPVIPDGWISCSERMPEETGDIIVVSDGIVTSGISYSRRDGFYIAALEYDDDEPIDGVTHWMPLPEPPQEVK